MTPENLICKECPNGCLLELNWREDAQVFVAGNKCHRGVGYAARILRRQKDVRVFAKEKAPAFSEAALREVALLWGVSLRRARYDIFLQGSPERTAFRTAFEDEAKNLFVLEQLPIKSLTLKRKIAETLAFLAEQGLGCLQPYCVNVKGDPIVKYKSGFWQMMPFVPGVALDRHSYMHEAWRGSALAGFLIDLNLRSKEVPLFAPQKSFSLKNYIYRLIKHMKGQDPLVQKKILCVMDFLEKRFMDPYDKIPVHFCHGDYHPMNIIWSKDSIRCVIDWEFLGYKSEIYDMANLIGCVGVENPQGLTGGLVRHFISDIKRSKIFAHASLSCLVEFIVALRFAWLSEWLRRRDNDMILLETEYMTLLIENRDFLYAHWKL